MKRTVLAIVAVLALTSGVALAHGNAEHVQGTVTSVTATAISVRTAAKQTRTITIDQKTMFMRGKAHLSINDVKVGDRVVFEVDKKTSIATEVKLGPAAATNAPEEHRHKG